MRCSIFLSLAIVLFIATGCCFGAKAAEKKPAAIVDEEKEVLDGLPEACRQPVAPVEQDSKKKKDPKDANKPEPACTLRKPFYSDEDQANHFCIICKQNDTQKKPAVGPAAGGDGELVKQLQQIVTKQLGKNADFEESSGLTIILQGVEKPINISKALDDPNSDTDGVLQQVEEVLYMFKNKTIAKVDYKQGEPSGPPEEVTCAECEKQLKELKPQQRTPEQQQNQQQRRREQEERQLQRQQSREQPDEEAEGDNAEEESSEDANGQPQGEQQRTRQQPQDARRRQQEQQQRERERQQREQQQRGYQQPQYDSRPQQRQPASGSAGASTKSVPLACRQETHFTTEDGICSLHVPQSDELCVTCKADSADNYQVLQSLDSLAQRLAPNNYQYLASTPEIVLVFDPAPRDNRVIDFSREFAQHDPLVRKLEEAYYFFPNQSVAVQKFDDFGRQASLEPFRTYDDYLRRYQREHDQDDTEHQQRQNPPSPNEDAASRDYNQDYYRRQQEQYRQQQQQQQTAYAGAPSTDAYGRVYPSAQQQTRPAYYQQQQQQQQEEQRRREYELRERQRMQQQVQATLTPTVYASADYYRTQPTTVSTTPPYGRTYAYTDRTNQPAYGTMKVSLVTMQPTSTITITADQYGNIVQPTAYAPYIRPDQRGQRQTMCLVVEPTTTQPQQYPQAQPYRNERSPVPVRTVPYAGQPGIYERNPHSRV